MLAKDEFEECVALLSAYYEDQKYAMQGCFSRAQWAARKIAEDLLIISYDKTPFDNCEGK